MTKNDKPTLRDKLREVLVEEFEETGIAITYVDVLWTVNTPMGRPAEGFPDEIKISGEALR